MKAKETIQTYMTICPHSIGLDQSVKLAREMMRKYGFRHLPVQSGGVLVGVVSDRDIKFATAWAKDAQAEFDIEEVYTPEPYVVTPDTALDEVVERMSAEHYGCVLVAHEQKVVGIFTTTDACRVLAEKLRA